MPVYGGVCVLVLYVCHGMCRQYTCVYVNVAACIIIPRSQVCVQMCMSMCTFRCVRECVLIGIYHSRQVFIAIPIR